MKKTLALFAETISRQLELYTRMAGVLRAEREALVAEDVEGIHTAHAEKDAVLAALAETNEDRRHCVTFFSAAFDVPEREVTLSYLASVSAEAYAAHFSAVAERFAPVLADVADLNFRNALLIKKMYARNKELVGLIKRAGKPALDLYGKSGRVQDAVKPLCTGVA